MIYVPQKNSKRNSLLLLYGVVILLFLCFLETLGIIKSTICHFAFFFESVFYTFILTKFILPTYTYVVEDSRFKIIKANGNKVTTECDIDLVNIKEILTYREYKNQENKNVKCVYNYNANFHSFSCKCLVFEYSGIREAILFEPNHELINLINKKREELTSI